MPVKNLSKNIVLKALTILTKISKIINNNEKGNLKLLSQEF